MKHPVISLRLHDGEVTVDGRRQKIRLPEGCIGICFAFESKKASRKYWGKNCPMVRIAAETEDERAG